MKLFVVLVLCLAVGTQAGFFSDIGKQFKLLISSTKDSFKDVFGAVKDDFKSIDLKNIAGSFITSLLGNLGTHDKSTRGFFSGIKTFFDNIGSTLKDVGGALLQDLKGLTGSKAVGELGGNFITSLLGNLGTRDLGNVITDSVDVLNRFLKGHLGDMEHALNEALEDFEHIIASIHIMGKDMPLDDVLYTIEHVVANHHGAIDKIIKTIEHSMENEMGHAKRGVFSNIFSGIMNFFKPLAAELKSYVSNIATTVKHVSAAIIMGAEHTLTTVFDSLKPHIQAVEDNIHTLVSEGGQSLKSLEGAVKDIFHETVTEAKIPIANVVNAVKDGVQIVENVVG